MKRSSIARKAVIAAVGLSAVLGVSACGSSSNDDSSSTATSQSTSHATTTPGGGVLAAAAAETRKAEKGDFTSAPTGNNPATPGKNVWLIVSGMASPTAANTAKNVQEAAGLLGWKLHTYDGQLNPSNWPKGVQSAIGDHADGIIAIGIDCPYIKPQLAAATKAGIKSVGLYSLNCDEIDASAQPGFTSGIGFGSRYKNLAEAYQAWGGTAAAYVIAANQAKANVINMQNSEYDILKFYQQGFDERLKQCDTCENHPVPWLAADFGQALTGKTQAALSQNPTANAVQANVNPTLGITQAVAQSGKKDEITSIGGFGLASDFDAIRNGQGLNAVVAIPDQWWSFAAADTLTSLFNGTDVRDSGTGWQLFTDKTPLPPKGENYTADSDYVANYKKGWGVS